MVGGSSTIALCARGDLADEETRDSKANNKVADGVEGVDELLNAGHMVKRLALSTSLLGDECAEVLEQSH